MDERLEHAPVGILTMTTEGAVIEGNARAQELLGRDSDDSVGSSITELFPASVEDTIPRLVKRESLDSHQFEEYYPELDRWLAVDVVPDDEEVTLYVRDVSDRYRDQRTIANLRNDLDRLTNINALISDVLGELVGASTREEIAETICERLGGTDLYAFALVAERDIGGDEMTIRAADGSTGRTLTAVENTLDGDDTGPEQRAVETASPQLVDSLSEETSLPESVRRAAFADGIQSILAVPLTYGSSVYGVVSIYATDQDAFSERERTNFTTVGEMAGFAINAARHRTLLLSDTVVELTVDIYDGTDPLVAVTETHDGTLSLDGLVPQHDEPLLCYATVMDGSVDSFCSELRTDSAVESCRVIGNHEGGGSLEITLESETVLERLIQLGATIRSGSYTDETGELVVDLPPAEDVRRVAEQLDNEFEITIRAKREKERVTQSPDEFRDELGDSLTERQENALRTAFFADYFESPRGSSAEDVANALGITGPTLLYHLRAGQKKLLAQYFESTES